MINATAITSHCGCRGFIYLFKKFAKNLSLK